MGRVLLVAAAIVFMNVVVFFLSIAGLTNNFIGLVLGLLLMEFMCGAILLFFSKYRKTGSGMIVGLGITLLVGLAICSGI